MSTTVPNPPSFTSPQNNQSLPDGTTQVTLSWTSVPGATAYALRANDLTEPLLRLPANNCTDPQGNLADLHYLCADNLTTTSYTMKVKVGHSYHCWVHAVNGAGLSQPGFVDFRVLSTDAAEFLFQCVQYILLPGEQVNVLVRMRNVGSTTWTPAAFRLGSQNPQDNTLWGTNRVSLPSNVQIPPGGFFDFLWRIQAPAATGTYNFQWRMVHDGVRWFGDFTPNVRIQVRANAPVAGKLTRNSTNGRIMADGVPVVLRGGHYDLFQREGVSWRSLIQSPSVPIPILYAYPEGVEPCTPSAVPNATVVPWPSIPTNWGGLFNFLRRSNNNLLRIWLSGGTRIENGLPIDLMPFKMSAGKYQVREAVEQNQWNTPFFDRLSTFAQLAEQNGVYLQISIFNYQDLTSDNPNDPKYQTWSKSFWNPDMCTDLTYGQNNLVHTASYLCADGEPANDKPGARRQCFFIRPPAGNGLPIVQSALVKRVVQALTGRKNIILEVMNEPHRGTIGERARFNSRIVTNILQHAQAWRPLISVNASGFAGNGEGDSDMDWWKNYSGVPGNDAPNYAQVDIISYHGLSAYRINDTVCGAPNVGIVAVDRANIHRRLVAHSSRHPGKAIMFSTDAVREPKHIHRVTVEGVQEELHLRDGHVVTNYYDHYPRPSVRSDLADWAYWCFKEGAPSPGYVHFQNHSTYELPYCEVGAAWQSANPS